MFCLAATNNGEHSGVTERSGFFSGRLWRFPEWIGQAVGRMWELFLPYDVSALDRRPSVCQYGNRLYMVGGHTANIVVDEYDRVSVQGIMPPTAPPTISGATGTGTLAFLSFWDEKTDEHSPLSEFTEIGDAVPRTWSNLPTYVPDQFMDANGWISIISDTEIMPVGPLAPDTWSPTQKTAYLRPGDKIFDGSDVVALLKWPTGAGIWGGKAYDTKSAATLSGRPVQRASHVILWLSVAGGLPRIVTKVRLGTTTVTESVDYTDFGEAHPGDYGRFPLCTINTIYHDRQLMAGDKGALDTVYLSAIGFPERYEGFKFTTRNGEAVTALIGTRDYCLILTANSTYILQGYTEDDMEVQLLDNGVGALGHNSNVIVNGFPCVTTRNGLMLFNGSWHPMMTESSRTFADHVSEVSAELVDEQTLNNTVTSERFFTNAVFYQEGWLVNNPLDKTLQLFLGRGAHRGELYSIEGGAVGQQEWVFDWFHPLHDKIPAIYRAGTYSWVLNYETMIPQAGGTMGESRLTMDALETTPVTPAWQYSASEFLYSETGGPSAMWFGDSLGRIHREFPDEPLNGAGAVLTPAYFFGEVGGFEREGKTLIKLWSFVYSWMSSSTWKVTAIGGDEWAGISGACWSSFEPWKAGLSVGGGDVIPPEYLARQPRYYPPDPRALGLRLWPYKLATGDVTGASIQYLDNVAYVGDSQYAEGPSTQPGGGSVSYFVPKTVWEHPMPTSVSGRSLSFLYVFEGPAIWRGVGGFFGPGPATRPRLSTWTLGVDPAPPGWQ